MDNNIDFIVVQITQHPLTHVPPKLNSELTFWHSDDTTVLEHLLPSEISYYGPLLNVIIKEKSYHIHDYQVLFACSGHTHKLWSSPELGEVQFVLEEL